MGDEKAFRKIYDRYRARVYSYALKITLSAEAAEDVVHDVFLKLWDNGGMDVDNVRGFLRVVTRNHTLNVLRKQMIENRSTADALQSKSVSDFTTDDTLAFHETRAIVFNAISRLSPQRKQVFLLCREEGLKYDEVAKRMNLSPLTVKTHMQHALRFLREYMDKYSS